MNQTHQVIGTCAAHISWNLRSRDSEVEFIVDGYIVKGGYCRGFLFFNLSCWGVSNFLVLLSYSLKIYNFDFNSDVFQRAYYFLLVLQLQCFKLTHADA